MKTQLRLGFIFLALFIASCGGGDALVGQATAQGTSTIGGTLSNLPPSQSVVLQDNGTDNLKLTGNGIFTFATKLTTTANYNVTVATQPTGYTCAVTNGSGVANQPVTNVVVTCSASVASVNVYSSSNSLPSDQTGVPVVTLTALIEDSNNNAIPNVPVIFKASSGSLTVTSGTTNAAGTATATLGNGRDPTNRTITVTASAGGISSTVDVQVQGTSLAISGPTAISENSTGLFSVDLVDSTGTGIPGTTYIPGTPAGSTIAIAVSSLLGNQLSATTLTPDGTGKSQVTLTGTVAGADVVTVKALGLVASAGVTVSNDVFNMTMPVANAFVDLNTSQTVSAQWIKGNVPQVGAQISFSATRGTLSSPTAVTDNTGTASVTVTSDNAGPAVITATDTENATASVSFDFLATDPSKIVLEASPFTVSTGQTSSITAVVTDPAGNLVQNQVVDFQLTDVTNGFLSVAEATTDVNGTASTTYTGGTSASATNGVIITGTVQSAPSVHDAVDLTVAQQAVALVIGTGDAILELNDKATYTQEWVIIVTDPVGNAVQNRPVQISLTPNGFFKGYLCIPGDFDAPETASNPTGACPITAGSTWVQIVTSNNYCSNADLVTVNATLPQNQQKTDAVAAVAPVPPSGSCIDATGVTTTIANVSTNSQGLADVCVYWPENYSNWVAYNINAQTVVEGTSYTNSQNFVLPVSSVPIDDLQASPPNQYSPFGTDSSCNDFN